MDIHTPQKSSMPLDLTLYLVTDSTPAVLGHGDLAHIVEEGVKGGVSIVQYRDKHAETGELIRTATKLHQITKEYGVPLLINDRVDVALAIGAEGVHLGQDDMSVAAARTILGKDAIIGITASSADEAQAAQKGGADYLGIGTAFATPTKEDTKSIIGTAGIAAILRAMGDSKLPSVAIGGINASNVRRVLHQTTVSPKQSLDGVAVVSAIVQAKDPKAAANELKDLVQGVESTIYPAVPPNGEYIKDAAALIERVPAVVKKHGETNPLCHNMTNLVVQNFAANVCLATGSSPIMSNNGNEAPELAKFGGALVINMGTATAESLSNYLLAIKAYNAALNPVLFDPVGGGATTIRKDAVKKLMATGFFDIIKGNEGEVKTVFGGSGARQRGVDSGPSASTIEEKAKLVTELARRERNIVLMTGSTDFLSDGVRTIAISNGTSLLGQITGSGCALGSTIASYVAVHREDKFLAALAAILHYEIAAERANVQESVRGPGTFVPAFLDELNLIKQESMDGKKHWCLAAAKIEMMQY
jgi:thiamine-phosphate diphosphorylase / hydroxyethylthiazole kinase